MNFPFTLKVIFIAIGSQRVGFLGFLDFFLEEGIDSFHASGTTSPIGISNKGVVDEEEFYKVKSLVIIIKIKLTINQTSISTSFFSFFFFKYSLVSGFLDSFLSSGLTREVLF